MIYMCKKKTGRGVLLKTTPLFLVKFY